MAEERAKRAALRRQRILNQGTDRLLVVKGEIDGNEITNSSTELPVEPPPSFSQNSNIPKFRGFVDDGADPDSILEQVDIPPESAPVEENQEKSIKEQDALKKEEKKQKNEERLKKIKALAEADITASLQETTVTTVKPVSRPDPVLANTAPIPASTPEDQGNVPTEVEDKTHTDKKHKKKKKPASSSVVVAEKKPKKKKKTKVLGPPLVSTEFLDSLREGLVIFTVVALALVAGFSICAVSPDSAWEKQIRIKDPRVSLQMYINKLQMPSTGYQPLAPKEPKAKPKPKKQPRDSKLEEALAKLELMDEDEESTKPKQPAPEDTLQQCSDPSGQCSEENLETFKDPVIATEEVLEEFKIVDETWPGLQENVPPVQVPVSEVHEGWEFYFQQALVIGLEIWNSLPFSSLPYVPLTVAPILIRLLLRFVTGFIGFILRARPLLPPDTTIWGKATGLWFSLRALLRDISLFLSIVVIYVAIHSTLH